MPSGDLKSWLSIGGVLFNWPCSLLSTFSAMATLRLARFTTTLIPTFRSAIARSYASKASKTTNTLKIAAETEPYSRLPPILHRLHEAKAHKGKSCPIGSIAPERTVLGLTFESLAKEMSRNEVYVAALFYGQAKPSTADIKVRLGLTMAALGYFSYFLGFVESARC